MTDGVKDLVNAIINGDSVGIDSAFNSEMATRISARIDDMRVEVARNMFNAQVGEEVEQIDEVSEDC